MRAGLYIDQRMGMPLRMEVQGEALRIADGPVLVAASPSEFRAGSTTYRFSADNVLTRETVDGDVLEYRSMHPWHPAARELLPFAGRYHSAEALATALVAVEDDGLTVVPEDRHDDALVLHPLFADTFEFSNATRGDGVLHFSRDAKGRLTGFEMSNPRVHGLAFRRSDGGQRSPP
jgi:hypothetical protein